jgi:hypothetical protein
MLTPLLCLLFVYVIQYLALSNFKGLDFSFDFPILFNVPSLSNLYPQMFELQCLQWYSYDFTKGVSKDDMTYVGVNDGHNASTGLLSHMVERPGCEYYVNGSIVTANVPFFKKPNISIN